MDTCSTKCSSSLDVVQFEIVLNDFASTVFSRLKGVAPGSEAESIDSSRTELHNGAFDRTDPGHFVKKDENGDHNGAPINCNSSGTLV